MALRIGTEDKKKVYIAAGLFAVMVLLLARFLWQNFGPSPSPEASAPAVSPAASSNSAQPVEHAATKITASQLDPTLHPELMRAAESLAYTGNGRNIFSLYSTPVIPKPIASARPVAANAGPAPPPPPPPISLRFYGYAAEKNGHKRIFLLQGDDIFIASEGDVVDRRYRIGTIGAASVQVEDLPYHNIQTLPLAQ